MVVGLREKINRHQWFSGVIVVVVIVAAICAGFYAMPAKSGSGMPDHAYFIDPQTGNRVVEPNDTISPLTLNGKEYVRATLYTYTDCDHAKVAYYEKYTPAAIALLEKKRKGEKLTPAEEAQVAQINYSGGRLICKADGEMHWIAGIPHMPMTNAILVLPTGPNGEHPRRCDP